MDAKNLIKIQTKKKLGKFFQAQIIPEKPTRFQLIAEKELLIYQEERWKYTYKKLRMALI